MYPLTGLKNISHAGEHSAAPLEQHCFCVYLSKLYSAVSNPPPSPALIMNFSPQLDLLLLPSHFCTELLSIIDDASTRQEQNSVFNLRCLETLTATAVTADYLL